MNRFDYDQTGAQVQCIARLEAGSVEGELLCPTMFGLDDAGVWRVRFGSDECPWLLDVHIQRDGTLTWVCFLNGVIDYGDGEASALERHRALSAEVIVHLPSLYP